MTHPLKHSVTVITRRFLKSHYYGSDLYDDHYRREVNLTKWIRGITSSDRSACRFCWLSFNINTIVIGVAVFIHLYLILNRTIVFNAGCMHNIKNKYINPHKSILNMKILLKRHTVTGYFSYAVLCYKNCSLKLTASRG